MESFPSVTIGEGTDVKASSHRMLSKQRLSYIKKEKVKRKESNLKKKKNLTIFADAYLIPDSAVKTDHFLE